MSFNTIHENEALAKISGFTVHDELCFFSSLTIAKVDKEASQIWKFQRYALIADLLERFSLPPPFTIISIVYLGIKFIINKLIECVVRCCKSSVSTFISSPEPKAQGELL